jgi:hypothetical protein
MCGLVNFPLRHFVLNYLSALHPGVVSAPKRNEYHHSGGKERAAREADNLTAISEPVV